jgi:hypothetical protein
MTIFFGDQWGVPILEYGGRRQHRSAWRATSVTVLSIAVIKASSVR